MIEPGSRRCVVHVALTPEIDATLWPENLMRIDHLDDLGLDDRMILKLI
jgi:hypothetical protein